MVQQCTAELVIDILEKKVGVPSTTPNIETATWEELGVESLGLTETFSSLVLALDREIPLDDAINATNIQELVARFNA